MFEFASCQSGYFGDGAGQSVFDMLSFVFPLLHDGCTYSDDEVSFGGLDRR